MCAILKVPKAKHKPDKFCADTADFFMPKKAWKNKICNFWQELWSNREVSGTCLCVLGSVPAFFMPELKNYTNGGSRWKT